MKIFLYGHKRAGPVAGRRVQRCRRELYCLSLVLIHRKLSPTTRDAYRRSRMHESSHTSVIVADDSRCVSKFPTKAQNGPVQRKFMLSVKLQLIISLLVEEKTTFTHFS
jgi:hypothetical protein